MPELLSLASELHLLVAKFLGPKDLSHLIMTCQYFYSFLAKELYRHADGDVYIHVCSFNKCRPLRAILNIHPNLLHETLFRSQDQLFNLLHIAVLSGSLDATEELLKARASSKSSKRTTQVIYTAGLSPERMSQLHIALRTPTQPTYRDQIYRTVPRNVDALNPLYLATTMSMAKTLLDHNLTCDDQHFIRINLDVHRSYEARHPLVRAVESGNIEWVEMLLDRGFDVNTALRNDWNPGNLATPIHFSNEEAVTRLLLKKGAKAAAKTHGKRTAIISLVDTGPGHHGAVSGASPRNIAALIEAGVDVNAKDAQGHTALHYAAMRVLHSIVGFLLDMGADPNVVDYGKRTPLHLLCSGRFEGSRSETAKKLLDAGADIECVAKGKTPLEAARKDHDLVRLLSRAGETAKRTRETDGALCARETILGGDDVKVG